MARDRSVRHETLVVPVARSDPRIGSRLHDRPRRSGARHAVGADGPRDGHGIAVRRRRRVLCVAHQRRRGRHHWGHRVDADHRRHSGEKDDVGAAQAAAQSIALGLIVALAIGVFGYVNAERLMRLMGATPSMMESSLGYTKVMFAGNATVTLLFLNNAIFRGSGDPAIAMRMLWISNAINIAVCPLFIFGLGPFPEMGVTGAAIGTNIGRGTAVLTQLWMLTSGRARIHITRSQMRLVPSVMLNVCRLSGSGFLQILIDTSSYIGLVRVISTFGSEALAGYTIGIRLVIFAMMPA